MVSHSRCCKAATSGDSGWERGDLSSLLKIVVETNLSKGLFAHTLHYMFLKFGKSVWKFDFGFSLAGSEIPHHLFTVLSPLVLTKHWSLGTVPPCRSSELSVRLSLPALQFGGSGDDGAMSPEMSNTLFSWCQTSASYPSFSTCWWHSPISARFPRVMEFYLLLWRIIRIDQNVMYCLVL